MSRVETAFCASAAWRPGAVAQCTWALRGHTLRGDVLEVGCGSGDSAVELARRSPGARLRLVDLDPAMVEHARRCTRDLPGIVGVDVADATRLGDSGIAALADDARFDQVVCLLTLHHVIDWPAAVHEFRRVLRPGGRLVGYDLLDTPFTRLAHGLDGSRVRLFGAARFAGELHAAGFDRVVVRPSACGLVARFRARVPGDPAQAVEADPSSRSTT